MNNIELEILRAGVYFMVEVDPVDITTGYATSTVTGEHGIVCVEGSPVSLSKQERAEAHEALLDANNARSLFEFLDRTQPVFAALEHAMKTA